MNIKQLTFLFWNINRKPLASQVANIVKKYEVDIVVLAECLEENAISINKNLGVEQFIYFHSNCTRIRIFAKSSLGQIEEVFYNKRMTIRKLQINGESILFAALHLLSKTNIPESVQYNDSIHYNNYICQEEQNADHHRTLVVGDFNMNPFEKGMADYISFNAVMTQGIAQKERRVVQSENYMYFYNPMWSLMGDLSKGVSGTYFYNEGYNVYQWQMYDQVLVRPQLLRYFDTESVQILKTDGEVNFLKDNGEIDKKKTSDHLPILFSLKF